MVLKRILGSKREEVTGGWRKLHNEELHNLYSLSYIRMNRSQGMRSTWHITCMGEMRNAYRSLVGMSDGRDLGVDRRAKLRWILGK
jgi:hypothetical protein